MLPPSHLAVAAVTAATAAAAGETAAFSYLTFSVETAAKRLQQLLVHLQLTIYRHSSCSAAAAYFLGLPQVSATLLTFIRKCLYTQCTSQIRSLSLTSPHRGYRAAFVVASAMKMLLWKHQDSNVTSPSGAWIPGSVFVVTQRRVPVWNKIGRYLVHAVHYCD